MLEPEYIPEGIAAGQGHRSRPNDGGVEQHDREHRPEGGVDLAEQVRNRAGVGEAPTAVGGPRGPVAGHDQRRRTDHHDEGTQCGVGALVADETRRDALVDNVGLLKEQLPRGHRGADHRDDQQHRVRGDSATHARDDKRFRGAPRIWMGHQQHWDLQQRDRDEREHRAFPALEAAGGHDGDQRDRGQRDDHISGDADVVGRQGDANEFGDQGQKVQQEQVTHGKPAPAAAEPLIDQPRVSDPGDRTEPDHHLLVNNQHRDQQHQHPQQAVAVVLSGLHVGRDASGVVVADHHDQAGPDDRQHGG